MKFLKSYTFLVTGIVLFSFLVAGCRTNKYVPEKEYLLSKVTIRIDNKTIDKNTLKTYQKQKPNTRIFGFWKFHLGLYNLSSKKKENNWLKRIGEAPVIYDPFLTEKTRQEFERFMHNKGYYNAVVKDSTLLMTNRKAEVYYSIISNQPYQIHSYETVIKDDSLRKELGKQDNESLIKPNSLFDSDLLGSETQRLLRKLQNDGYYKATKNIFYYEADSTKKGHGVDLKMVIEKESLGDTINGVSKMNHERYTFRNFYYLNEIDIQSTLFSDNGVVDNTKKDTLWIGHHCFVYKGKRRLKTDLLMNANHLADKGYYSSELVDRTYNEYFALRLFKLVNIRFVETGQNDAQGNPMLDCYIQLTPGMSQSYSASIEGTNSLGNFGIAGNLGYQHKNLFRGGEIFDLQFLAATQKQSYGVGDSATTFNSVETGVDAKITVPKFIAPFFKSNFFQYSTPQTFFNISYNYQKRPDYTRTIARSAFGYQWKSSDYTTHRVNLLDINLVKMFALDSAFLSRIENLYIRSSYIDHSITAFNYAYTYSTQTQKKSDYVVLKYNIETAGNVLYAINQALNRSKFISEGGTINQYHIFNTPFAQYVKFDLEYRKGWMDWKYNGIAIRAFGGAAFAYGNSDQIPFERKYFSGGANGIRAWPIRTLGPGSYRSNPNEFPNQSGDIKLEANAEYRFKIIDPLEGAFFFDMGNIWSVRDNRQGAEFKLNKFYKEIALGTGFGLRYDFSYVILRLDLGVKMHDPSLIEGARWISPGDYFKKGNVNLVFGIGYPF
ncbi:MAG: BamA/TamA family outer membrane protein [Bacteroidetes bacterium]|nr:BamA/TamA family outer membrane protein [Bacteroidota bacterium]